LVVSRWAAKSRLAALAISLSAEAATLSVLPTLWFRNTWRSDLAWKVNLLFYEYFHGDNGAGLGAMHQTGWTALVADLLLDPPRRARRLVFYDDASIDPDLTDVAAGPAG
jgi:hypothetical protein